MTMRLFRIAILAMAVVLATMTSCERPDGDGGTTPDEEESFENEWTYQHNKVGPLVSTIWCAFIDTREMDLWHIYLSPVTNIKFEEVTDFSPVKITLPVDFPLDGSKIRFSEDAVIVVTYGKEQWSHSNAPNGYVKASYDARINDFEIRFSTASKLKGYYRGELTIIE